MATPDMQTSTPVAPPPGAMALYHSTCMACAKVVTKRYSTSFSLGIATLARPLHDPVYAVYGFVRFADEIVDSFHQADKPTLFAEFERDTWAAIAGDLSLNPILDAFAITVNAYGIDPELIRAFLHSMEMDLAKTVHDDASYQRYIYGSAEVVGLMCLQIFCKNDKALYERLREPARRLGAAFQKVNFLRDIQSDFAERGRVYFPDINLTRFDSATKQAIEADIAADFDAAYHDGIGKLPNGARAGVYLAYLYYKKLFNAIRRTPPAHIMEARIRVPDGVKLWLLCRTVVAAKLRWA